MLKPFLIKVEDFMEKKIKSQDARFDIYFRQTDYVGYFEDFCEAHTNFAKELTTSSQFIHFCDDYFTGAAELNNYQMFRAIVEGRGEVSISSPEDGASQWDDLRGPTFMNLEQIQGKKAQPNAKACLPSQPRWPELQPVVFNFRMPSEQQKAMLFERIQLNIEKVIKHKERQEAKSLSRAT